MSEARERARARREALGEARRVAGAWSIPEVVAKRFPEIADWTWDSPMRLRAKDDRGVLLVVVDRVRAEAVGAWTSAVAAEDREHILLAYGELHERLAKRLGERTACEDGAPIRFGHKPRMCRWCGSLWDDHPEPPRPPNGAAAAS